MNDIQICLIIPCYNHQSLLERMLTSLESCNLPCIVIDDGSKSEAREMIENIASKFTWVTLLQRKENGGKGDAVRDGFREAAAKGFTHALQIDADCQHNVNDIPTFIEEAGKNPDAIILGQAVYDETVPKSRLYGRYITHFWVMIETLSLSITDTMCGFRVYPLNQLSRINVNSVGSRMDFDVEIIVKAIWAGIKAVKVPTEVIYPEDGISNFHYLKGNLRISAMHTRLCLGMFIRIPMIIFRKFQK